jgi:hypothetical protein
MDWHKLIVAESGFSMLDIYGRHMHKLDLDTLTHFADSINAHDEPRTLFPLAPITAIPRRFFREQMQSSDPVVMQNFVNQIAQFNDMNRTTIRATRLLIDFHVAPTPVPPRYLDSTERLFIRTAGDNGISDLVILGR